MTKLCEQINSPGCDSSTSFNCNIELPSFYFEFGRYWFEVQSKHYTEWATTENDTNCRFRIEKDDTLDHWSLGLAFMQGWYTVHDYEDDRIGFVAHTDSTKARPLCTTVEACKFTTETN